MGYFKLYNVPLWEEGVFLARFQHFCRSHPMSILKNFINLFSGGERVTEPSGIDEYEKTAPTHAPRTGAADGLNAAMPEVSASDLATRGGWESKKVRVWQKGDIILGTYKVQDVKSGGMGNIYIAQHLGWKVQMAIKSPNEVILSNRDYFERVLREADAWIGLGLHPHIAYCYYMRQIEGVPNFFIEYVDGGNMRDWIKDIMKSELGIGLDLAIQFCHGMAYAHSRGMIHRDIKPENILLTNEGLLKITDFGIAMLSGLQEGNIEGNGNGSAMASGTDRDTRLTQIGHVMGSPSYMALEQWKDSRTVDLRADIYSFGVCMFEMFCGRRPFAKTAVEASETAERPLNPLSIRKDIHPRLVKVMLRCISHDKAKRFANFTDLGHELIEIYREIYNSDPAHTDVADIGLKADGLNNRAVSYTGLGRNEEAEFLWSQALAEDPQHFESIYNYGYMRWLGMEITYSVFMSQLRDLRNVRGSSPDYWRSLAWLAVESGDDESIESIQSSPYRIDEPEFLKALEEYQKPLLSPYRKLNWDSSVAEDVLCFTLSPDGKYLLTGSTDGMVRLWDILSGNLMRTLSGHSGPVLSIAVSPDNLHAASGEEDGSVIVWDLSTRKRGNTLPGNSGSTLALEFIPGGDHLLIGGRAETVVMWDFKQGRITKKFEGHQGAVNDLALAPNGRNFVSASSDNTLRLWDIASGRHLYSFIGHGDAVQCVDYSPNGTHLVSGSADNTIRVWDTTKIAEVRQFRRHNDIVSSVAFSADGKYIISGGWDKMINVWNVSTGHGSWQQIHTDKVTDVRFVPGTDLAISSARNGKIVIWRVRESPQIPEYVHPFPLLCRVQTVAILGKERQVSRDILAGAKEAIKAGELKRAYRMLQKGKEMPAYQNDKEFMDLVALCAMWGNGQRVGLKNAWPLRVMLGHSDWVADVRFTSNYQYILSCSWDKTVRLWDPHTGAQLRQFDQTSTSLLPCNFTSLDISSNNALVVSGSRDDGAVYLWSLDTGEVVMTFTGHESMVSSVCFSRNGRYTLSAGEDRTVRLWETATGKEVRRFTGHRQTVFSACFSPDNRLVASSSDDATVKLWDIEKNVLVTSFEGHYSSVFSTSFSSDGRYLLTCSEDGSVRIWEVATGKEMRRFEGHESWVTAARFTPDGKFVLSAGKDSTVRLWRVSSGEELRKFEGHEGWVTCLNFSHDARYAVSGGWDNKVVMWEFDWMWEL